jgi:hypothetical protein
MISVSKRLMRLAAPLTLVTLLDCSAATPEPQEPSAAPTQDAVEPDAAPEPTTSDPEAPAAPSVESGAIRVRITTPDRQHHDYDVNDIGDPDEPMVLRNVISTANLDHPEIGLDGTVRVGDDNVRTWTATMFGHTPDAEHGWFLYLRGQRSSLALDETAETGLHAGDVAVIRWE